MGHAAGILAGADAVGVIGEVGRGPAFYIAGELVSLLPAHGRAVIIAGRVPGRIIGDAAASQPIMTGSQSLDWSYGSDGWASVQIASQASIFAFIIWL